MFERVFVEKRVVPSEEFKELVQRMKLDDYELIEHISDIWGRVKKPYLQKRDNLNLFIGKKDGTLLKEAPDAYGLGNEKHYYYIHSYNCIYECNYCYLQGHFNSPDIVMFINHSEIKAQMRAVLDREKSVWFHAGEFSDSLALSHYTGELDAYYDFFKANPQAKLELRTKSVNLKALSQLEPLKNIFISFSLSSFANGADFDKKCPSIKARINALAILMDQGYEVGIHFDPIVYTPSFEQDYAQLLKVLENKINLAKVAYFSIGVVRFTADVFKEVENNYPNSPLRTASYIKSFDGKLRYQRPLRNWMMGKLKDSLISLSVSPERIYLCME